jgi:polyisoprenoid-binding protein YceI
MKSLFVSAALAALFAAPAFAQDWALDAEASSVEAHISVFNAPTILSFDRFDATIRLDPDALETASIEAVVYAASGVARNAEGRAISDYQNAMDGASGLDVANYEEVRFVSEAITATAEGYDAAGLLSIRGMEQPVVLSFTLEIDGDRAVADGGFELNRTALGMTNSSWGTNVSDAVELRLHIEADRAVES